MNEPDIKKTYKAYQSSRIADPEDEILRIVAMARKKKPSGSAHTDDKPLNADEAHVATLFKFYQQDREPNREQITATIMDAAREKIRQRQHSPASRGKEFLSTPGRIMDSLLEKITTAIPKRGWQITAPALALIAMVVILVPQLVNQNGTEVGYADNGIPAALIKKAPQLAAVIQHATPMPGFGFSDTIDLPGAVFQLGIMTTDLYILAAADQQETVTATAEKIRWVVSQTKPDAALLSSLNNLTSTSPDPEQLRAVAHALEQRFQKHDLRALFRFGKWIEATLLAAEAAPHGGESELLSNLLMQWQKEGRDRSLTLSPAIDNLIARIDKTASAPELSPGEIRKLRHQLLQLKAALQ